MKTNMRGRKNAAGNWLSRKYSSEMGFVGMLAMAVAGFAMGFGFPDIPVVDGQTETLVAGAMPGLAVLAIGIWHVWYRRIYATYGRGLEAERRVGDVIDHAIAARGCAVAHDVREALRAPGNVDHVVMTPASIWVLETKSGWVDKRRFPEALRQVGENVRRIRRHLDSSVPVRGALVIADVWERSTREEYDWDGEPVKVFGVQPLWRTLCIECRHGDDSGHSEETEMVRKKVWSLGSAEHLGA